MKALVAFALTIFMLPGKVIAWWEYLFPSRGQIIESSRRRDNTFIHAFYSAIVWGCLLYFGPGRIWPASSELATSNPEVSSPIAPSVASTIDAPTAKAALAPDLPAESIGHRDVGRANDSTDEGLKHTSAKPATRPPIRTINCLDSRLSVVDIVLCSSSWLRRDKQQMDELIGLYFEKLDENHRPEFVKQQAQWEKGGAADCRVPMGDIGSDEADIIESCLSNRYGARIEVLRRKMWRY